MPQREEFTDAERLDWLQEAMRTSTVYMDGNHPWSSANWKVHNLRGPTLRMAVDNELRKERGDAAP